MSEPDHQNAASPDERRPFQFGLRSLFLVTSLFAMFCSMTAQWGVAVAVASTLFLTAAASIWFRKTRLLAALCLVVAFSVVTAQWGFLAAVESTVFLLAVLGTSFRKTRLLAALCFLILLLSWLSLPPTPPAREAAWRALLTPAEGEEIEVRE